MKTLNPQEVIALMSQNAYYHGPKGLIVFSPTDEQQTLAANDMDEYTHQAATQTGVFTQALRLNEEQYLALKAYTGNTFKA